MRWSTIKFHADVGRKLRCVSIFLLSYHQRIPNIWGARVKWKHNTWKHVPDMHDIGMAYIHSTVVASAANKLTHWTYWDARGMCGVTEPAATLLHLSLLNPIQRILQTMNFMTIKLLFSSVRLDTCLSASYKTIALHYYGWAFTNVKDIKMQFGARNIHTQLSYALDVSL